MKYGDQKHLDFIVSMTNRVMAMPDNEREKIADDLAKVEAEIRANNTDAQNKAADDMAKRAIELL